MPSLSPSASRRRPRRPGGLESPQGFFGELLERASRGDVLVRLAASGAADPLEQLAEESVRRLEAAGAPGPAS